MKLLSKYNRANVITTLMILCLSSVCYYFIIRYVLLSQLDQDLKVEQEEVLDYIQTNHKLPNPAMYQGQEVIFSRQKTPYPTNILSSESVFDEQKNEYITVRQLVFQVSLNGIAYQVSIRKSQTESESLLKLIVIITLIITTILLLTLFIINRVLLRKLWRPFNKTLQELKRFNLSNEKNLDLDNSVITEFAELNAAVRIMTTRVVQDYETLKTFTENASHEIQTPLAIIKSKMELLVQSEDLKKDQVALIHTVQETTNRLSKLNQSLILLAKIENHQFHEKERVDLLKILTKQMAHYEELISAKKITTNQHFEDNLTVFMNETLAEILVSNLITNAIKYNIQKGFIHISTQQKKLTIANTGNPLQTNVDALFERFHKDAVNSDSLGLGLSIVKKITEQYGFKISYSNDELWHTLILDLG